MWRATQATHPGTHLTVLLRFGKCAHSYHSGASKLHRCVSLLTSHRFGINDVYETREEQVDFTTLYNEIVTNYFQQVEILYSYGARRIVVFTVPPIGRTTLLTVETPSEAPYINNAVANFNSILLQQATSFQQAHADVNLRTVDTASVFNPILDNPTANGAPDNTCFDSSGTACLWFNDFHPGLVIQTAVGHAAYGALQSEGFYS